MRRKGGDAVHASGKLYKVAEEAVKVLTWRFELPEYGDVWKAFTRRDWTSNQ